MTSDDAHVAWQEFRTARETELRRPYGWLTTAGFAWLPETPGPVDGLPGTWSVSGDDAVVEASAGDGLAPWDAPSVHLVGRDTQTVAETDRVPWLAAETSRGRAQVELLRRGGRLAVRWRTETSPEREAFTGVATYPYDPAWAVIGRFTPYAEGTRVDVATHRPELRQNLRAVGEVAFELAGESQRLVVTAIKYGLSVEFHDPTNGTETPAWRQLKVDEPAPDGTVVLDFNRTILMWFAFTDHATCPAPSEGNTLTVPVRAGERLP